MAKVVLVGPEIEENLSLRYLAAALDGAGHASAIVAFNHESELARVLARVLAEAPDVVGLSLAFQWRAPDFLALAVGLRRAGYAGHVTLGGHFATFAASEILSEFSEVSSVCRQEAEITLPRLVDAVTAGGRTLGEVPGLALRMGDGVVLTGHAPLPDLATTAWPDRRGEPARVFGHGIAPLVASRGCYANCSFCCIAAWHEESLPGKRYRVREVGDVADEMVAMQRERGIDVFVFHDDNFFVPGHRRNAERFAALADAVEARGIGRFATVVKARPTDVSPEVFAILKHRLRCIRAYIGIETDADQGLRTLRRWAKSSQNHVAVDVVRELGLYTCFNMLLFDPDTTLESLAINVDFLEHAPELPSNFGRVELYAGTPLLARMQAEGKCRGDWLAWDYDLASPEVERVFRLAMAAFAARNFGEDALANRIMGTRFDVEVVRHFHPEVFASSWLDEGKELTRALTLDTVRGLRAILTRVRAGASERDDDAFARDLAAGLRATESRVRGGTAELARALMRAVGRGSPLTEIGDRVATPLQSPRVRVEGEVA